MKRFTSLSAILVFSVSAAFTVQAQMKDMDMNKGMEMKKDSGKATRARSTKGPAW
jgi:hypothetical protein